MIMKKKITIFALYVRDLLKIELRPIVWQQKKVLQTLKFLAKYSTKYNKKIVIQTKSQFNSAENSFISKLFAEVDYKIS